MLLSGLINNHTMDKIAELTNLMCNFMQCTIYGHESGFYKTAITNNNNYVTLQTLKNDNVSKNLITFATMNYLNKIYKSLILEDDPFVIETFGAMQKCLHHSYICLLNLLCVAIVKAHNNIKRTELETCCYQKYMDCVENQLNKIMPKIRYLLTRRISHECKGIDIKTCNPNEPLFIVI